MKLHGIAMVRNEADVIEVFVRHNLTVLDSLTVVDHGSADATSSILAALASEGLPLKVSRETSLDYRQSDIVSREVGRILSATGADFVFLLDADEFLKVPSRLRLEAALASLPSGMHAVQPRRCQDRLSGCGAGGPVHSGAANCRAPRAAPGKCEP